jgi:hypothetical protein
MARTGWSCEAACQVLELSGASAFSQKVAPAFRTVARLLAADPLKTLVDVLGPWGRRADLPLPAVTARGWSRADLARVGVSDQAHRHHLEKFTKLLAADPARSWLEVLGALDGIEQEWFEKVLLTTLEAHAGGREPETTAGFERRYLNQTGRTFDRRLTHQTPLR